MTIEEITRPRARFNESKLKLMVTLAKSGNTPQLVSEIAERTGLGQGYLLSRLSEFFHCKTGNKDKNGKPMHQLVIRKPVETKGHFNIGYCLSKYGYDRLEWFRIHRPQLYQNTLVELDKITHPEKYLSVEEQDKILRDAAKEDSK